MGDMRNTRGDSPRRSALPVSMVEALVLAAAVIAVVLAAAAPALTSSTEVTRTRTVRVGESESLWAIARANPLPGAGTAETVAVIRRINGLEGSDLSAGQILEVPATASLQTASR